MHKFCTESSITCVSHSGAEILKRNISISNANEKIITERTIVEIFRRCAGTANEPYKHAVCIASVLN